MHAKDKQKCQNFLMTLKADPDIVPFLVNFDHNPSYYYDFDLIVSNRKIDAMSIEKNLKGNKYKSIKDFYKDIKGLFQNFVLFCFQGDEVNVAAKRFIKLVNEQQRGHIQQDHIVQTSTVHHQKQPVSAPPPPKKEVRVEPQQSSKKASLAQKLEMIYLLRSLEGNFQEIKDIAEHYKIGREVDNQYVIKLEGMNWLEMLRK